MSLTGKIRMIFKSYKNLFCLLFCLIFTNNLNAQMCSELFKKAIHIQRTYFNSSKENIILFQSFIEHLKKVFQLRQSTFVALDRDFLNIINNLQNSDLSTDPINLNYFLNSDVSIDLVLTFNSNQSIIPLTELVSFFSKSPTEIIESNNQITQFRIQGLVTIKNLIRIFSFFIHQNDKFLNAQFHSNLIEVVDSYINQLKNTEFNETAKQSDNFSKPEKLRSKLLIAIKQALVNLKVEFSASGLHGSWNKTLITYLTIFLNDKIISFKNELFDSIIGNDKQSTVKINSYQLNRLIYFILKYLSVLDKRRFYIQNIKLNDSQTEFEIQYLIHNDDQPYLFFIRVSDLQ